MTNSMVSCDECDSIASLAQMIQISASSFSSFSARAVQKIVQKDHGMCRQERYCYAPFSLSASQASQQHRNSHQTSWLETRSGCNANRHPSAYTHRLLPGPNGGSQRQTGETGHLSFISSQLFGTPFP